MRLASTLIWSSCPQAFSFSPSASPASLFTATAPLTDPSPKNCALCAQNHASPLDENGEHSLQPCQPWTHNGPPQQGQTPQGNPGTSLAVASSPGIKNWAVTSLKAGFLIWDGLLTRYIYKAGHWILKCVLFPSHWLGSSSLKSMWHSGIQYIPWKLSVSCNVIKQTINLQQQQQGLKISPISVTRPFLQQPSTLERIKTTQLLTRL